jgi:hypothetical protein
VGGLFFLIVVYFRAAARKPSTTKDTKYHEVVKPEMLLSVRSRPWWLTIWQIAPPFVGQFATCDGNVLPSKTLRKREETGVQQVSVSQRAKANRR